MRFVPVKSIEQQSRLFVHRARQGQGYVERRTALINGIHGLLSELGIVLPLKSDPRASRSPQTPGGPARLVQYRCW